MPAYVKIGGQYKEVPNADLFLKQNNSYTGKPVIAGYVKVNGYYKQFHQGSDPLEFTMTPTYGASYPTRFARGTNWGTTSNGPASGTSGTRTIACGRYYTGANTQRYYGLLEFTYTSTGRTLAQELGDRPVVKSASLRLTRDTQTHGYSTPGSSAEIHVSHYNSDLNTNNPVPSAVDLSNRVSKSAAGLTRGSTIEIDLMNATLSAQDLIDDLGAKPRLAVTNVDTGLTNYGASLDQDYLWFFSTYGVTDANKQPLLTIELDYT